MSSEETDDNSISVKKTFLCDFDHCHAAFTNSRKLTNHIRRHTGQRPFACDVINCTKTYTNSSHLRRHKRTCHEKPEEKKYECKHEGCPKVLANLWSLKKHMNRMHNPDRKYPYHCETCKQGFHKKSQLHKHIYLHTGIANFECDKCNKKFLTLHDCNRHKRTHTAYTCECKDTFERWSEFIKHKRTCDAFKPICKICKKSFKNNMNLKYHMKIHIDLEKRNVYECPYDTCDRFYFYERNLSEHINSYHKKEYKKFSCIEPGCNKVFNRKCNLNSHVARTHNTEPKQNKPRKPRKDKGIPQKSALSKLLGLKLPRSIEKKIINGIPVKLNEIIHKNEGKETETVDKDNCKETEEVEIDHCNEDNVTSNSELLKKCDEVVNIIQTSILCQ